MQEANQTVSLVTVNYHSFDYVTKMLASVCEALDNVVVVDNFSDESERERIRSLSTERVTVLQNPNVGFAGGVNAGVSLTDKDDWVLLVNPDVTFSPDAVRTLIESAVAENLDLAVPMILEEATGNVWFAGGYVRSSDFTVVHEGIGFPPDSYGGISETEFVSGCIVLFSPKARRALFPLEESLFMYYEDVLMSIRAQDQGLKCAIVRSSIAAHAEGATSRDKDTGHSKLFYYYQARNRLLAAKDISKQIWARTVLTTPLFYLRQARRIIRDETDAATKLRIMTIGIWDGLHGRAGKTHRSLS